MKKFKNIPANPTYTKEEIEGLKKIMKQQEERRAGKQEEKKSDKIIDAIIEKFGAENIHIKSKKVKALVEGKLERYTKGEGIQEGLHFFGTKEIYKVGSQEFQIVLKASQMKNGKWWIQG